MRISDLFQERMVGEGQSDLSTSAIFLKLKYAKVPYFEVACLDLRQK